MSWKVEHLAKENIVHVLAEGSISTVDVFGQVAEGIALILEKAAPGAWINYSGAILEMPLIEIYRMPELFEAQGLPRATKMAITLPSDSENMHKYTFFDDVATNRGYIVRLFWEQGQAMKWLLREKPERGTRREPDRG